MRDSTPADSTLQPTLIIRHSLPAPRRRTGFCYTSGTKQQQVAIESHRWGAEQLHPRVSISSGVYASPLLQTRKICSGVAPPARFGSTGNCGRELSFFVVAYSISSLVSTMHHMSSGSLGRLQSATMEKSDYTVQAELAEDVEQGSGLTLTRSSLVPHAPHTRRASSPHSPPSRARRCQLQPASMRDA